MGDKLLLNLVSSYDFTCEITMLPWQCSFNAKMASRLQNVTDYD